MNYRKTIEQETIFDVLNLFEDQAEKLVLSRDLVPRIIQRDRERFEFFPYIYISHRINLKIQNGRVVFADIG